MYQVSVACSDNFNYKFSSVVRFFLYFSDLSNKRHSDHVSTFTKQLLPSLEYFSNVLKKYIQY
jgi:hypothetical protein